MELRLLLTENLLQSTTLALELLEPLVLDDSTKITYLTRLIEHGRQREAVALPLMTKVLNSIEATGNELRCLVETRSSTVVVDPGAAIGGVSQPISIVQVPVTSTGPRIEDDFDDAVGLVVSLPNFLDDSEYRGLAKEFFATSLIPIEALTDSSSELRALDNQTRTCYEAWRTSGPYPAEQAKQISALLKTKNELRGSLAKLIQAMNVETMRSNRTFIESTRLKPASATKYLRILADARSKQVKEITPRLKVSFERATSNAEAIIACLEGRSRDKPLSKRKSFWRI